MEKCDIETDNIITGEKENSNSEKVCLDDVKVKTEGNNNNFRIQYKNARDTYLTLFNAVVVRKNRIFVNSRIGALNVIKVWVIRQSITDIGTGSIY